MKTISENCEHCQGSGIEPEGWTLSQAQQNPKQWSKRRLAVQYGPDSNLVDLMPHVVSPVHFNDAGQEKCHKCNGSGKTAEFMARQYELKQKQLQTERQAEQDAAAGKYPYLIKQDGKTCARVLAAKNIRIELKRNFPGVKFSVRGKSFSMGDSIDVAWYDGPTVKQVEEIISKYQYGWFNGMEDIYEGSGDGFTDLFGDAKYVNGSRSLTYDAELQIIRQVCKDYPVDIEAVKIEKTTSWDGKHEIVKYLDHNLVVVNEYFTTLVHRIAQDTDFTQPAAGAPDPDPTPPPADGVTVTLNEAKDGVEIQFDAKPQQAVRSELKAHGFRWHRKKQLWYAKRSPLRLELAARLADGNPPAQAPGKTAPAKTGKPKADTRPDRFRKMADTLQKQIEQKRAPMTQNPTPRRLRQYNSRLHDADNLENTQRALVAMADAIEAGRLPAILEDLKTKAEIADLVRTGYESTGYYDFRGTGRYVDDSRKAVTLQLLIEASLTDQQRSNAAELEQRKKIEALEDQVRFAKIPGFFPTPRPVIKRLVELAGIEDGDDVLDPEAGKGDIADFVREAFAVDVTCAEINPTLCSILEAKGHKVIEGDFLQLNGGRQFRRIVMNPPFEKGQDIDHVRHAFSLLPAGGRVASVVSEGPFFRKDKKSKQFRQWLDDHGAHVETLDPGAFKGPEAFRQTGVAARIVVIDKD